MFAAAEGLVIELADDGPARAQPDAAPALQPRPLPAPTDRTALIATDPDPARVLTAAIAADGNPLLVASDVHALLRMVAEERPAVVIVQRRFAGRDALELCRAIRALEPADPTTPAIVVVASRQDEMDVDAGVRAGVTDWLLWPFKETYARTRMQSWVLRESLRWLPAPLPENEGQRLDALHALHLLDTPPEERFDRYTRIAAELFDVPIALVSLIDTDRQWYKSRYGIDLVESPRETAFCAHTILETRCSRFPTRCRTRASPTARTWSGSRACASMPARRSPPPTAAWSGRCASSTDGRGSSTSSSSRCCATWPTWCRPSSWRALRLRPSAPPAPARSRRRAGPPVRSQGQTRSSGPGLPLQINIGRMARPRAFRIWSPHG